MEKNGYEKMLPSIAHTHVCGNHLFYSYQVLVLSYRSLDIFYFVLLMDKDCFGG